MIYDFMQLTDADKVMCTIFMLRDDARAWWEGARLIVDLTTLTWADYKEIFYGKYFTADNRTRLAREFLELRQGDLIVAEYVRRFERGCYFVPMIASQLVEELKHFIEGLRATIHHDVRLSRATTFREVVDQALMPERDRNDMIKEAQNNRWSYQGRDQQESVEGTATKVENKVRCLKCEKIHARQCLTGFDGCYMCKKTGHFGRDRPQLKEPTKGRVFAMTQEQVDLDATFIMAYITKLGITPERMIKGYSVSLSSGEELHSNRVVRNCQMMMQNRIVGTKLIVLDMVEFDVILGMDCPKIDLPSHDFDV
ncbi:uncharacterized protein LOC122033890 [Zingiber officinale]|uniref:uncharacterized protein LOC122033890 n=1 Tax=Zingiber officinale TaxID=94328 RepID=UPI001C4C53DC|nr:uncharacterized protein LOC122033890 [Zingiber officinale]